MAAGCSSSTPRGSGRRCLSTEPRRPSTCCSGQRRRSTSTASTSTMAQSRCVPTPTAGSPRATRTGCAPPSATCATSSSSCARTRPTTPPSARPPCSTPAGQTASRRSPRNGTRGSRTPRRSLRSSPPPTAPTPTLKSPTPATSTRLAGTSTDYSQKTLLSRNARPLINVKNQDPEDYPLLGYLFHAAAREGVSYRDYGDLIRISGYDEGSNPNLCQDDPADRACPNGEASPAPATGKDTTSAGEDTTSSTKGLGGRYAETTPGLKVL